MTLFFASREEVENKRINEVFSQDFLDSNFWLYWRSMFAFEEWHSALEMKLYVHRFIHHIGGLPDFSALKFTKYNQYESLVLPLVAWLKDQGVVFQYNTKVTDVDFDIDTTTGRKQATRIHWESTADGVASDGVDLTEDDLLFMTIGSLTENSNDGDHHTAAKLDEGPAPHGISGVESPQRIHRSVVQTYSVVTSPKPSGNLPPSPLQTRASTSTLRRSPSATSSLARLSPVGSSR